MLILSIETSCDETAVSIIEAVGDFPNSKYEVLGDALFSQIDTHREYGGVFPALAKREHIATVLPMLEKALKEAKLESNFSPALTEDQKDHIHTLLSREHGLADQVITFYNSYGRPPIDLIAVTTGPGLEPALWVGINFAKALAYIWNTPVVPVDHMEGHILASVFDGHKIAPLTFPSLSLLVSGGHTELVLMQDWGQYEKIGQTRDDAVGEAFDKVARLLGLDYPGGPIISRLAEEAHKEQLPPFTDLPRPMLHSGDLDFSFSGLKTAVLYATKDRELTDDNKKALARDFEDAVIEVLIKKVTQAIEKYSVKSLIVGGGVSANQHLRQAITDLKKKTDFSELNIYLPDPALSTDNSIMIALSGHAREKSALSPEDFSKEAKADGNLSLS
ncbi:MAG: tRNA (adenosine(37)-N6)-threonylcarbamoyltransferase complex transferase subunit TsaD [Candidatus Nomurabacteria bacterium]|nr:MAG: tRNA (adenosine(37)-N6)-threonylcarbamoyltransferase complex transferase subunit TsaD [Candidatus Nomurabacteria bacterium]